MQGIGEVCLEVHSPKQAEARRGQEAAEGTRTFKDKAAGSPKATATAAVSTKHPSAATAAAAATRNRSEQVAHAGHVAGIPRAANGSVEPQLHGVSHQLAAAVPLLVESHDGLGHD